MSLTPSPFSYLVWMGVIFPCFPSFAFVTEVVLIRYIPHEFFIYNDCSSFPFHRKVLASITQPGLQSHLRIQVQLYVPKTPCSQWQCCQPFAPTASWKLSIQISKSMYQGIRGNGNAYSFNILNFPCLQSHVCSKE